jgi:hypothetical protein
MREEIRSGSRDYLSAATLCACAQNFKETAGEQHVLVQSLPGEIAELMFFDKEEDADDAEAMEPIPKSGLQCHCVCV